MAGPASNNPDNVAHATVDYADSPTGDVAEFRFEDIFGGGDKDFNDAIFQISGGIGIAPPPKIPEPDSAILLILGLVGVTWVSRRKYWA